MKRPQFPLFQTPLDLAHSYWKELLNPGDCVVDATCGNGHDTLFLAKLVQNGHLIAIDKQETAIEHTINLLKEHLPENSLQKISLHNQCHSSFPNYLNVDTVKLVVYNLGYLPGGDKNLTTLDSTTLESLNAALPLIAPGGAISVTCYPGHPAGKVEEEVVLDFAASLDPQNWSSCYHRWINRNNAPSLILIQQARYCHTLNSK